MRSLPWLVVLAACGGPPAAAPTHAVVANTPPPPVTPRPTTSALLAWPVAPFSAAQIAEAKGCDVEKLAAARYAKGLTIDALPGAFAPKGTCDQAVLAAACASRLNDAAPPPLCLAAYGAVVKANPAFAFVSVLPGAYFGKVVIAANPPAADHPLVNVVLDYKWGGLGTPVDWKLAIRDATTKPVVVVTGSSAKTATTVPDLAAKVAALGASLDSFLPITGPLEAIDCTDNYPEWTATLEFEGGNTLELSTHKSNLIGLGGPWQLTINNVTYLQLAPGVTRAVAQLVRALGLPIGQPAGEMCRGYDLAEAVLGK
jgi:hypothetical protein